MTLDKQNNGGCLYIFSSGDPSLSRRHASNKDLVDSRSDFGDRHGNRYNNPHLAIQAPMVRIKINVTRLSFKYKETN